MKLISVKRIWEHAAHNAFTDLITFQGAMFCVFREGTPMCHPMVRYEFYAQRI